MFGMESKDVFLLNSDIGDVDWSIDLLIFIYVFIYFSSLWVYTLYVKSVQDWIVWLPREFCLFSCNATWWSIAFPVRVFHHTCQLKRSGLLWTGVWLREVVCKLRHFCFQAQLSDTAVLSKVSTSVLLDGCCLFLGLLT